MADRTNTERFMMDGLKISGTAALMTVGGEMLMRRTNLSFAARGGVQAGAGILIGLASAKYAPNFAMGALTYGVVAAVRGAAQEIELRQFLAQGGAARPAVTGAVGTVSGSASGSSGGAIYRSGGALGAGERASYNSLYDEVMASPLRRQ